jgi:hypothetical protein
MNDGQDDSNSSSSGENPVSRRPDKVEERITKASPLKMVGWLE